MNRKCQWTWGRGCDCGDECWTLRSLRRSEAREYKAIEWDCTLDGGTIRGRTDGTADARLSANQSNHRRSDHNWSDSIWSGRPQTKELTMGGKERLVSKHRTRLLHQQQGGAVGDCGHQLGLGVKFALQPTHPEGLKQRLQGFALPFTSTTRTKGKTSTSENKNSGMAEEAAEGKIRKRGGD